MHIPSLWCRPPHALLKRPKTRRAGALAYHLFVVYDDKSQKQGQHTSKHLKCPNVCFDVFCFCDFYLLEEDQTFGKTGVFPYVCPLHYLLFEALHSRLCIRGSAFEALHSKLCIRGVGFEALHSMFCIRSSQSRLCIRNSALEALHLRLCIRSSAFEALH